MGRRWAWTAVLAALLMACSSGGQQSLDAGIPLDGGATTDGGAVADGGAAADGGGATDGGNVADGGTVVDGGAVTDGGSSCETWTPVAGQATAGLDCDATITADDVKAQICAGQVIATGLYQEIGPERIVSYEVEGDGSGGTILSCKGSIDQARQLVLALELGVTLTGCEYETNDYYSFEAKSAGKPDPDRIFRVNKCDPWSFLRPNPASSTGVLGSVEITFLSADAASAARVAQYLWFIDKDQRPSFYLVGGRPVTGPPVGHALCEAELLSGPISGGGTSQVQLRKVTYSLSPDTVGGRSVLQVARQEESKGLVTVTCP